MKRVWFAALLERCISSEAANSLIDLAMCGAVLGYTRIIVPYGRVDAVRNEIVAYFMAESSDPEDTLVMLDCDHAHPQQIIEKLVSHAVPVVGALAFRRSEPYDPLLFRLVDGKLAQPADPCGYGLVPIDALGFGAIAIQRSVFDTLEAHGMRPPWFRFGYSDGGPGTGEDIRFCSLCHQAGIPMYCDTDLVTPHLAMQEIGALAWEIWQAEQETINAVGR